MNYCKNCVLPDTRPNLYLDEKGVCNACNESLNKKKINWKERRSLLIDIISKAKKKSKGYDCLIPVSGGKDSTWQLINILNLGLNPLAVTWKTPARTEIGQKNLDNLINLGVDHIDYQINPKIEAKFMLETFKKHGSTAIPMHLAIFNIPLKIALKFSIPLIIWGENSAQEYGGDEKSINNFILNKNWFKKYGVTNGTTAKNWISKDITQKKLTPYLNSDWKLFDQNNIMSIFLGHFLKWDTENSYNVAKKNGFKSRSRGPKIGYYNFSDIDCDFISIHHWMKWYKFGFTRLMDNLSVEIRNNRITRGKALNIIKKSNNKPPQSDIGKFCKFVKIDKKKFFEIAEKHRNKNIWNKKNGVWRLNKYIS